MTITTRDQLINALGNNPSRFIIEKASIASTVVGQYFSLWLAAGTPSAGSVPTAQTIETSATNGSITFVPQADPIASYLAWLSMVAVNNNTNVEFHDRIAANGGGSGTAITNTIPLNLETLAVPQERIGSTNFSEVQWWLEVYTALGATNATASVNVTYDDGTVGVSLPILLGATPRAGRMYPIMSSVAGKFIKAVNTVSLSASTGTVGNFGIVATRLITTATTMVPNKAENYDWASLGLPRIPKDACMMLIVNCSTTSTGIVRGYGKIAHG